MAFISGKFGFVLVNGTALAFGKWKLKMKSGKPKIPNWKGGGFMQRVTGLLDADLSVEGPWDIGAMGGLAAGGEYTFSLGYTQLLSLVVTAIIDIDVNNDVEDTPRITVTGESDGTFSFSVN